MEMESESPTNPEPLSSEEAAAKAAILAECEKFGPAGITFVGVHFDGSENSGVTEEVKCFDSEYTDATNTNRSITIPPICKSISKR